DAVQVEDEVFRGIPSYSLYGKRLKPEASMLLGLDAVVYDIQDIGSRYYTYLYTLAYLMEACQEYGIPLVVLDRPNPIGGDKVEGGPIADSAWSFVGGYGLTPRYGMTVGEFAAYLKGEYFPGVELEVVPLEGWTRSLRWEDTGLPWPLPSPNIPSRACASVYPGTCLVEGTWFSEGRGTTRPFEMVGAPWIDGERLRDTLAGLELPGAVFSSVFFTPSISKHKDELCEGVLLNIIDEHAFNAVDTGVALVRTIRELWPGEFRFRETWEDPDAFFFDSLAGGADLRKLITSLAPLEDCIATANSGQTGFLRRRAKYLRYPF
ncbi:MAG: DUF1343 domain-containing protein, partial [Spirochaetota bacterium]